MLFTNDRVEYDKKVKAQSLRYPPRVGVARVGVEAENEAAVRGGARSGEYPTSKPPAAGL